MNIVVLVGGVGGAKLAYGLAQVLAPEELTIVVNTGDDFWLYGLRICPDMDTIVYTLAGLVDKANGWGIAGDTRYALEAFKRLGEETWFGLGDQDLATHIVRTRLLRGGYRMTEVTENLTKKLGVSQRILPMSDAAVATKVDTIERGLLDFQSYFVQHHWQPTVKSLVLEGIDKATVSDEVREALKKADILLVGPSNPWLSINPILSVPGMRELMMERNIPRVAISPIVGGEAIKGPAAKMMVELGYESSAKAVADYYGDFINGFVYDLADDGLEISVSHANAYETIMKTDEDKVILAQTVLDWIKGWM